MPVMIQDMASRLRKIRQPVDTFKIKTNTYRAIRLNIRQTTVVTAFVLFRRFIGLTPFQSIT